VAFPDDSRVDVEAVGDREWRLLVKLDYQGQRQAFSVPIGSTTDFASVPRAFVWFLPKYGRYTKAAILHDYLWRELVPQGALTHPEADGIFRRAMRELGVPFLRRWIMWGAVRLGALTRPGGRDNWIRDSWLVFPLALLAIPIVAFPALLILLSLAVFFVVEFVVYLPLRIAQRLQRVRGAPAKAVNSPTLELDTA